MAKVITVVPKDWKDMAKEMLHEADKLEKRAQALRDAAATLKARA